jgi:hypothetical protein
MLLLEVQILRTGDLPIWQSRTFFCLLMEDSCLEQWTNVWLQEGMISYIDTGLDYHCLSNFPSPKHCFSYIDGIQRGELH